MSFNYRKEEYALNKRLEKQRRFFKENGMSDEQIAAVEELEWDEFRYRRNQESVAITVPLMTTHEDGSECETDPTVMSYTDEHFTDTFKFGFEDERLRRIVASADETDLLILRMLSDGYRQSQIAKELKISEKAVSISSTKVLQKDQALKITKMNSRIFMIKLKCWNIESAL